MRASVHVHVSENRKSFRACSRALGRPREDRIERSDCAQGGVKHNEVTSTDVGDAWGKTVEQERIEVGGLIGRGADILAVLALARHPRVADGIDFRHELVRPGNDSCCTCHLVHVPANAHCIGSASARTGSQHRCYAHHSGTTP